MRRIPLHFQILIGLFLGLILGVVTVKAGWNTDFVSDYIAPIGTIFINSLKMIAVPLVVSSLIVGVANLGDITKLSRIGGKTIATYLTTTVFAISVGLILVNIIQPGKILPQGIRDELMLEYGEQASSKSQAAKDVAEQSPLQPIVDMVPENFFTALGDNSAMLQVVFVAILIGIALLQIPKKKGKTVIRFFDGLNDVIIKIVEYIMIVAPYGVFALMASLIVEITGDNPNRAVDLLLALLWYSLTVLAGLAVMVLIVYPTLLKLFSKIGYKTFFKGIRPAQLLAFSTSSSSATLPVTMRQVENELGVSEEVSSFVLPLGATVNMDGTSLYQGVATVFIAQALGMNLDLGAQLMIVLTATLASIGTAGVPSAGIVMLVIVLESVGVPAAGIALILAPDRILDMCRTVVNITGDCTTAMIVASTEGELLDEYTRKSNPITMMSEDKEQEIEQQKGGTFNDGNR